MSVLGTDLCAFATAYRALVRHGIWPSGGGLGDQPATFVDAVDIIDGEIELIRERQREEEAERWRRHHRRSGS